MSDLNNPNNQEKEESINFYEQFLTLKRQYKILISATAIFGSTGFSKAIAIKPLWRGDFQIVLAEDTTSGGNIQSELDNLMGGSSDSDLATEMKILTSPIVLMPVFDFYKNIYEKEGNNLRYKDWASGIEVELLDGTKVLNVSYTNQEKNFLIPVLDKISKEYQKYSKKDNEDKFKNQLTYLNQQIRKYVKKSKSSLKNAQTFAIQNNLTALKGDADIDSEIRSPNNINAGALLLNASPNIDIPGSQNFNIEFERIKAANEIKIYEKKLEQLKDVKDKNELFLLGKTDSFIAKSRITLQIEELDVDIEFLKANFTEKDEQLIKALELKETYLEIFKKDLYGYLNARLMDAKARMKASERPEGVLVKYRELVREANRDEQFLNKLEFERQVALMQKAMIINPWELISNPQVLDNPVNKSKKIVLLLWTTLGFGLGSGISIIREKLSGLNYSKNKLIKLIPYKLLAVLELNDIRSWEKEISTPIELSSMAISLNDTINLIPLGGISELNIENIEKVFKKTANTNVIRQPNLIREPNDINILIVENRNILIKEIKSFFDKVDTYNLKINSWILLD